VVGPGWIGHRRITPQASRFSSFISVFLVVESIAVFGLAYSLPAKAFAAGQGKTGVSSFLVGYERAFAFTIKRARNVSGRFPTRHMPRDAYECSQSVPANHKET
jgi:hypothetical protein